MTDKSFNDPILSKERTDRMMIQRWGEVHDLLGSVIYLISDASSYVTGIDLFVDGGWTSKGL
jgi:NAD(P)-dependent dehydrogenase (short-subunit alcohol dehydrogenase family)